MAGAGDVSLHGAELTNVETQSQITAAGLAALLRYTTSFPSTSHWESQLFG